MIDLEKLKRALIRQGSKRRREASELFNSRDSDKALEKETAAEVLEGIASALNDLEG